MVDKQDKKEFEEILAKHAEGTNLKLEVITENMGVMKESMVHMQNDISGLKTDVAKLNENVDNLTAKVDIIFEQTGNLTVDMEIVKKSVQRHEQKLATR